MKKAIILAAGVGKRLGNLTKDIPKCLLKVDSDNVLIDYSLEALKENNISEIIFVSGFAENNLREHISKQWIRGFNFQFIFNEKFSEYNNIYSAYLVKDIWDDETVLLNSDIIFDPEIFKTLSSQLSALSSFLVIDNTKTLDKEDMKVKLNQKGEIKRINKNLDIKSSFGEYIGITYLRTKEREKFLEYLEKNVKEKKLDLYYEDALDDVLEEISVYPCSTEGKPWTEVDTVEDYEIAKQIAKDIKEKIIL